MRKWSFVVFGAFAVSLIFGVVQFIKTGEYNIFDILMILAFGYFTADEIRRIRRGHDYDEPAEWEKDDSDRLG